MSLIVAAALRRVSRRRAGRSDNRRVFRRLDRHEPLAADGQFALQEALQPRVEGRMRLQRSRADVDAKLASVGNHIVGDSAADHRHVAVRPAPSRGWLSAPIELSQPQHVLGRRDDGVLRGLRGRVAGMGGPPRAVASRISKPRWAVIGVKPVGSPTTPASSGRSRSRITASPSPAVSSWAVSASTIVPPSVRPASAAVRPPSGLDHGRHAALGVVGARARSTGRPGGADARDRRSIPRPAAPCRGASSAAAAVAGRRRFRTRDCFPSRRTSSRAGKPRGDHVGQGGFLARDAVDATYWANRSIMVFTVSATASGRRRRAGSVGWPRSSCRSPRW